VPTSQPVRLVIATAVVGVYMALGWLLRLDPNAYLLLGIPLLLIFQLGIARRPLTELWLKKPPERFITWQGLLAAVPFLIVPIWSMMVDTKQATWSIWLWYVACLAGTIPLGATLVRATRQTWLALLGCLLTAGVLYVVFVVAMTIIAHHGKFQPHPGAARTVALWFLLYLPVCFSVEEVFFRGGLDSYIQREGDRFGWLTAIYLSCLWGWWHLPIVHIESGFFLVFLLVAVPAIMCVPGIPFSLFWRRGGSLLVTATVHALIDAIRNAMM
jgi:membrane protease YdiL (CAAX protease family)